MHYSLENAIWQKIQLLKEPSLSSHGFLILFFYYMRQTFFHVAVFYFHVEARFPKL